MSYSVFCDSLIDWSLHIKQEQAKEVIVQVVGWEFSLTSNLLQAIYIINVRGHILQGSGLAYCKLKVLCTPENTQITVDIQLPRAQSPIRAAILVPLHNHYPSSHPKQQKLKMINMLNQAAVQNLNVNLWIFLF